MEIYKKCLLIVSCVLGLYAALATQAEAALGCFGSNCYEFVEVNDPFNGENNAWWTARDAAAASVYNGITGHLATITSQEENDFIFGLVQGSYTGFVGAWLGGKAPEGWLVGPEAGQDFSSYSNWAGIEPNNEGYAYISIGDEFAPGHWADDSPAGAGQGVPYYPNDPVIGYIVEYEGASLVSEPATIEINPATLNLKSKGKWLTCYIELSDDYDVADIDFDSIELWYNGESILAEWGDIQDDVLMVKFDRSSMKDLLETADEAELVVTGEVDGIAFEGSDTIRVISKGK